MANFYEISRRYASKQNNTIGNGKKEPDHKVDSYAFVDKTRKIYDDFAKTRPSSKHTYH